MYTTCGLNVLGLESWQWILRIWMSSRTHWLLTIIHLGKLMENSFLFTEKCTGRGYSRMECYAHIWEPYSNPTSVSFHWSSIA